MLVFDENAMIHSFVFNRSEILSKRVALHHLGIVADKSHIGTGCTNLKQKFALVAVA
jgi:hypothetical protein